MLAKAGDLPPAERRGLGLRDQVGRDPGACLRGPRPLVACARAASRTSRRAIPSWSRSPSQLADRAAVLDGEVVALDAEGRPRFQLIQSRMGLTSAAAARQRAATTPVDYVDLRPAPPRRPQPAGPSLHRAPRAPPGAGARGPALAHAPPPARRRLRAARGRPPAGARGGRRQALRQPLPAGQAQRRVDQGAGLAQPGVRDRRLHPRARAGGPSASARSWSATTTGGRPSSGKRRGPAARLRRRRRLGPQRGADRAAHPRAREARERPESPFDVGRPARTEGPPRASGASRSWSARSPGPSGPTRAPCASPPSRACATTRTRARSSGSCESDEFRAAPATRNSPPGWDAAHCGSREMRRRYR